MLKIHQDFTGKPYRDGYMTPTETIVTVVSTSGGTQLVAANPKRTHLTIQNIGAVNITIRLDGSTPVAGAGLLLQPFMSVNLPYEDGTVVYGAILAIAASSTCAVYVLEGVGV